MTTDRAGLPRYDGWAGELRLLDPRPNATDAAIGAFVSAAIASDGPIAIHATGDEGDAYALLTFARRHAVFALRSGRVDDVVAALAACSLAIGERVDPRDVIVARGLVDHAVARIGVARLAEDGRLDATADRVIDSDVLEAAARSDVRSTSGLVEVETDRGIGVVGWGFEPWSPSLDVLGTIVRIGEVFDADDYVSDDPMIATELPHLWLRGVDDDRVASILEAAPAVASVSARMRPEASPTAAQQQLTAWLVETATEEDANALAAIQARVTGPFVATATSVGRLFSITIARSFVEGIDDVETGASIDRFAAPIGRILRELVE